MTTPNKLSKCIFAMAIMLVCSVQAWAQSRNAAPATVSSTPAQKNSAQKELANFKADSPIPQLNDMRKELLMNKAELEKAQMAGKLTPAQVEEAKAKIADQEAKMQPLVIREQRMLGNPAPANQTAARPVRQPQKPVAAVKETAAPSAPAGRELTPSELALKNFKADAQNPQLNSLRYELLRINAELEVGQLEKTFSPQQISEYKTKISYIHADIQKLASGQKSNVK